jgi:hypothetical protein
LRLKRAGLIAGVACAALAAGLIPILPCGGPFAPPSATAQNLGMRVVSGTLLNANDQPIAGATVFLKNLKTKSIRSYTTDEKGHFRFTGSNRAEDQELWAEKDGKKSVVKTVSSWDTRKEFECELRLK